MTDASELLRVVAERGPVSAQEVADAVGCTRRAADFRLRQLYLDGELEPSAVAGGRLLWRRVDDAESEDPERAVG